MMCVQGVRFNRVFTLCVLLIVSRYHNLEIITSAMLHQTIPLFFHADYYLFCGAFYKQIAFLRKYEKFSVKQYTY